MTNPILTIAQFEFFYQFRQPLFYLFALLSFGQGIWYVNQIESQYAYADPAITAYLVLASLGSGLAVSVVLLTGQSLTKDLDFRTTAYLYSLPITSRMHFAGRFVGVLVVALLLGLCYLLGIVLYFIGTETAVPWLALVDGFVRLIAENILIVSSITFALTVWLRGLRGAYIALFVVVFYFLLTEQAADDSVPSDLWQLLDPFGVAMARESAGNLPFSSDPTGFLSFTDLFFINRILWLGFALGLLAQAEIHFSFQYFMTQSGGAKRPEAPLAAIQPTTGNLPASHSQFTPRVTLSTLFWLVRWEIRTVLAQPLFSITAVLLVGLTVLLATMLQVNPDFPILPTTTQMTAVRLPMDLFVGAFLLVMTTELLFRERTIDFWPIYNTLPQHSFVLLLPRLGALVVAAAAFTGVLFLTGVSIQLSHDFTDIDWHRYSSDLLGDSFPRYCQLICLGAFISSLTSNRLYSHLATLFLFSLLVLLTYQSVGDLNWFAYSFLPGSATYSDLTGYGSATSLRVPVQLLWWSVALLLLLSFLITWNRGVPVSFRQRPIQWLTQLKHAYRLLLIGAMSVVTLAIWQVHHVRGQTTTFPAVQYATHHVSIPSTSGHAIGLHIRYHHPYQVQHMARATEVAMRRGEKLFGPYPFTDLWISETPARQSTETSAPGRIWLPQQQGWIADNQQPDKTDYIDYVLANQVFRQWLDHRLRPANTVGAGFVRTGLPEYLALQLVHEHYGDNQLRDRLAQRVMAHVRSRRTQHALETSPIQSVNDEAADRYRTPLLLTSIGQVWGDKPLSYTISQFYHTTVNKPGSATAAAFAQTLARTLPDSLSYLQTYLTDRLEFDLKVGSVVRFASGLRVDILASKWREGINQKRFPLPATDYLPLVVLDANDKPIYRKLVRLEGDQTYVVLPPIVNARKFILDPIGAWPEPTKRDNAKLL